jgi:hypothetical protein
VEYKGIHSDFPFTYKEEYCSCTGLLKVLESLLEFIESNIEEYSQMNTNACF